MPLKKTTTAHVTAKSESHATSDKALVQKLSNQVEKKSSMFQTVVVVLLVVITAMSFLIYKESMNNNVESSLWKVEAMKVGGEENFKLLQEILNNPTQKQQYKQQFESLLAQLKGSEAKPAADTNTQQPEAATGTTTQVLAADQIAAVTAGYVSGNPDAPIAIVEYSDVECPFCKRHHTQGTIKQVVEKYNGQVKYLFKHFPLGFHQYAQKGGEALECLGEQLGNDQFYAYIEKVYAGADATVENLTKYATELGANTATFQACLNEGKFAKKVQDEMAQGASIFQINGTPGNVVINTKTGKRKLISGAYPYSEFEKVVNELLQ